MNVVSAKTASNASGALECMNMPVFDTNGQSHFQRMLASEETDEFSAGNRTSQSISTCMSAEETGAIAAAAAAAAAANLPIVNSADMTSCGTQLISLVALAGAAATQSDENETPSTQCPVVNIEAGHRLKCPGFHDNMQFIGELTVEEQRAHRFPTVPAVSVSSSSRPLHTDARSLGAATGSKIVMNKNRLDHQKKYRSTEKGRAAQRKAQEKYRRSDKGRLAQTRARRKWRENHVVRSPPSIDVYQHAIPNPVSTMRNITRADVVGHQADTNAKSL